VEIILRELFLFYKKIRIGLFSSIVAPKWKDSKPPPKKLQIDIRGNGTLLCDAVGDPEPAFTWYQNGKQIFSSM